MAIWSNIVKIEMLNRTCVKGLIRAIGEVPLLKMGLLESITVMQIGVFYHRVWLEIQLLIKCKICQDGVFLIVYIKFEETKKRHNGHMDRTLSK